MSAEPPAAPPALPCTAHKGDAGRVLLVAGSEAMPGAAILSARAAQRAGAGLVAVGCLDALLFSVLPPAAPEAVLVDLTEAFVLGGRTHPAAAERLLAREPHAVLVGPGLGDDARTRAVLALVLEAVRVPLVLDADALTLLAEEPGRLMGKDDRDVIITPHPGEMSRLVGMSIDEVQANRLDIAADFAATHRVYVVLKGHRTVIATPAGRVFINPTGNPGMATGGTGDVLTGMIAAWLAQLLDAEAACRVAVFLHGAAGDLAEAAHGQVAMTVTDVLARLGDAVTALTERGQAEPAGS